MDSYNFHFERMSTLDLHPLSLPPVSRLSPAKSSSSIVDQFSAHHHHAHHHQHGKGDSAYSSFSGGSTAPDYPSSPFLPDLDLQPSALHQYADLKYVKAVYHPGHVLQADARSMDQLYRSMEAISQQYRYSNGNTRCHSSVNGTVVNGSHGGDKPLSKNEVPLITPSPPPPPPPPQPSLHPPTPPARVDSFITTRNLENSRVHHQGAAESQPQPQTQPQQPQLQQHSRPQQPQNALPRPEMAESESGRDSALRSDPVRAGRRSSPLQPPQQQPPVYRPHLQQQPHDQNRESLNPKRRSFTDNKSACEQRPEHKSADALNRSPPRAASQPEQRKHGQPAGGSSSGGGWNRNYSNKNHSPLEGQRKRAHSAHDILDPELNRPPSPWSAAQHLTNSSIQHKGQFYFVTGVCKPAEPAVSSSASEAGSEGSAAVETYRLREKERSHSTLDNMFKPPQGSRPPSSNDSTANNKRDVFCSVTHDPELISGGHDENRMAVSHRPSKPCSRSFDALLEENHLNRDIGRHTANHPIFYCGPEENAPTLQIIQPAMEVSLSANHSSHPKREEQAKKGRRQPLGDIASERINKETTPMLYHLTGASRAAAKPNKDVHNFSSKGKGTSVNKTAHKEPAAGCNERATAAAETAKEDRGVDVVSASCNTLDDSFKKYYKEKLKVAQSKVLRETSFKRRDLQLSWPHRIRQRPSDLRPSELRPSELRPSELRPSELRPSELRPSELRPSELRSSELRSSELSPAAIHSAASSQDSEASTDTLTPSVASVASVVSEDTERGSVKEEATEKEKEARKESEKENVGKPPPPKVAQPQVARIGGRKRLTMEQKKICYSEPEKLHQLGDAPSPNHTACRSLGNEFEMAFSVDPEREKPAHQREQGLVAARRQMFETRGRALSASSVHKNNLKHLQHKALVDYMERKTGQKKQAEPQQPEPQVLTTPTRQRHSLGEKPSDWGARPLSGSADGPKKKLNRPHSAGRILDAPSSSMRYAQFFSSQSGSVQSGGRPGQAGWRESQGKKCASAESLLDQPEPPSCFRNRSTSTPHAFEAQGIERDTPSVNATESSSLPIKAEEEEPTARPEGQQRVRVVAGRGKSMEELGTVKVTRPSALSKSSEQLDQLKSHQTPLGLEREKRSASFFGEGPREAAQGQQRERKDPWGSEKEGQERVGQNRAQGQVQNQQTQKKSPLKQDLTLPLGSEECTSPPSPRSSSPASWPRVLSGSTGSQGSVSGHESRLSRSPGSQGSVSGESRLSRPSSEASSNPPSPRGQETSVREVKSASSSPSTTNHTKVPSEKRRCSPRVRTSPPSSSSSEREQSVDEPTRPSDEFPPPDSEQEVSLSCGVTTDPSLWILPPEREGEQDVQNPPLTDDVFVFVDDSSSSAGPPAQQPGEPMASPSSTSASDADSSQGGGAEEGKEDEKKEEEEQTIEARGAPEGETRESPPERAGEERPQWAELAEAVVRADQSLARVLYPLTNRKTALMLMEQLLSEDTLLMEEHYKKKQEHRGAADSSEPVDNAPCLPAPESPSPQCPEPQNKADILEKKRVLVSYIEERFRALEETRGALQTEVRENGERGEAVEALVRERCPPVELERYALFIGDLERVVSLLLCLSARLARVQNALSTVDHNTDAEEKESLDNRHRLLCKQRDDAKDLKDNLDRRESVVSGFLSRQLSAEQLQEYRRFVQTKASLLIRQKDLDERQRLGEEQLEALRSTLPL